MTVEAGELKICWAAQQAGFQGRVDATLLFWRLSAGRNLFLKVVTIFSTKAINWLDKATHIIKSNVHYSSPFI